jgi:hypothetical protein
MKKRDKIACAGAGCVVFLLVVLTPVVGLMYLWRNLTTRDPALVINKPVPALASIDVADSERFLNDLKLSPLWKVENEGGEFIARARVVGSEFGFGDGDGMFLFEFVAAGKPLPKGWMIENRYLRGEKRFSSFSAVVRFSKPERAVALAEPGKNVSLDIYGISGTQLESNSTSELAVKLSSNHEIYVVLFEQGKDPARKTTFLKLPLVMKELAAIANAPGKYRVEQRYAAFFRTFFKPPFKEHALKRFPGMQDRDTLYGYFKFDPEKTYEGVNVKISHPVYCPDEGTSDSSRLRKAEYLGTPYFKKDLMFFLIEDNAVYLPAKYNKQFGTFSGKGSFKGNIEIRNAKGSVLLKSTGQFKGWER